MTDAVWGYQTCIDLYNCDPEIIRSRKYIKLYLLAIVKEIDMKAYGEPIIKHFGSSKKVEGFTMIQMIETSLISGHFVEMNNSAFIDIFSCKDYDHMRATTMTQEYFKAPHTVVTNLLRRIKHDV